MTAPTPQDLPQPIPTPMPDLAPSQKRYQPYKLDAAAVREIRTSSETSLTLARRFAVSEAAINAARSGETWRRLNGEVPPQKGPVAAPVPTSALGNAAAAILAEADALEKRSLRLRGLARSLQAEIGGSR